jgi:hypothetical protein
LQDPWNYEQSTPSAPFLRGAEENFSLAFLQGLGDWSFDLAIQASLLQPIEIPWYGVQRLVTKFQTEK